ncbi:MAG: Na+/glucose cotransporter [Planctomycetes bacterium RBG_16_64_12]|nr:MAG: Na+/glucose cotransporter [Planctomycetes bacterium RBG_16_64_12]
MEPLDWIVVALYFALLLGVAWWVIRQGKDTADDYFLAGRNLGWFIVGASIFSSNIGSEHLVGLAGSGCTDGVAMAHYELHAWCLLVLGWVMVPFYARSMVFTMPEFLEKRFSPTARWVLSIISLVAYVLTKIAVGIFAGGIVFGTLLPELKLDLGFMVLNSFWIGSVLVIVLTGVYTVIGGLRAVAYTEALQTIILVVGSVLVTVFGLIALGGWGPLREICGSEMFNLWKPLVPAGVEGTWAPVLETNAQNEIIRQAWYFKGASSYPWLGMLFCAPVIGLWYWCTDQYIVQRALGAPNERQARRGTIFAAFLKLLPVFIFIIPGMICFALAKTDQVPVLRAAFYEEGKLVGEHCQAAFPLMVKHVLPVGVRGIVVAGLLSALMSSLAGVFNASSTLFTMDLYQKFRPGASQHQLVWIGRVATAAMVLIGLAWVPVIQGARGLYDYLQSVQGYLAPPIFVVFFFGVFMKRLNAKGCLTALVVGFLLGVLRLTVDTPVALGLSGFEGGYPEGSFFWIVNNIYFQYYSLFVFVVSVAVMILVSYATEAPSLEKINGLTYGTVSEEDKLKSRSSWNRADVVASAVVLLAILAAYLYFTG